MSIPREIRFEIDVPLWVLPPLKIHIWNAYLSSNAEEIKRLADVILVFGLIVSPLLFACNSLQRNWDMTLRSLTII